MTVIAMGSDAPTQNEVAPAALPAADGYFCDRLSQVRLVCDLHHAIEAGPMDAEATHTEPWDVIARKLPGRAATAPCIHCIPPRPRLPAYDTDATSTAPATTATAGG